MSRLSALLFLTGVFVISGCAKKLQPATGNALPEVYMSTYELTAILSDVKMPGVHMPELKVICNVYSDGTRAYSTILDASVAGMPEVAVNRNDGSIGYVNCAIGIGAELDAKDVVVQAYKMSETEWKEGDAQTFKLDDRIIKCKVISSEGPTQINLWMASALPAAVNLGSCHSYPMPQAVVKMNAWDNNGVKSTAKLIRYEKSTFDFAPYDALLKEYEGKNLPLLDRFGG